MDLSIRSAGCKAPGLKLPNDVSSLNASYRYNLLAHLPEKLANTLIKSYNFRHFHPPLAD